jgi:Mg2+/Co2+ transporter CorB
LIRDINKRLNWDIEEGDHAYNLTAFIIGSLGRIPEEKENFDCTLNYISKRE